MKIIGIISEYNPIHIGHIYHMEQSRRAVGGDAGIICVMSGNYVQRGDFAIYDKWSRAEAAVRCGADLVVELPLPYVLSSAEHFARGAVSLLNLMGVVTHISFGSESGDVNKLSLIADALINESCENIADIMKTGKSYAVACEEIVTEALGNEFGQIIKSPNNILGVEYIKSLKKLSSTIEPVTVSRVGSGHDCLEGNGDFVSASYLRNHLRSGADMGRNVPESALHVFRTEEEAGRGPVFMENAEQALLALLRSMSEADFAMILDASEGIENRLMRAVKKEAYLGDIIQSTKSKRYPESRIRRMLLSASLGLRTGDRGETPPYIKILATNDRGRVIIREITNKGSVPLITKPAIIKKLSPQAQRMIELEARGTDLYVLAHARGKNREAGREWRQGPRLV